MENARGQIVASSRGLAGAAPDPPYNQPDLKLMIVGCGRVGSQIAADMDRAGHEVVIVDRDPNAFSRAASRGALTEGDNRNIMASQIARHIFKVPHVVTRIYDPERAETYEKLGVHTICPTIEGAKHIERVLMERS